MPTSLRLEDPNTQEGLGSAVNQEGMTMAKFARVELQGEPVFGLVDDEKVTQIAGTPFGQYELTEDVYDLGSLRLLSPCTPSKVLCMALNYQSHQGGVPFDMPTYPEAFFKTPNAVIGPGDPIVIPTVYGGPVEEEGEVVVVIGKQCKGVSKEEAAAYVLGYTCGNDVSAREWQFGDKQWWRGKSSDTFAPIGPFIVTDLDPGNISFRIRVNGVVIREGNTRDLVFDIPTHISFISQSVTLEPGDVIFTGTPGVPAKIGDGDVVDVELDGVGVLRNPVKGQRR